LIRTLEVFLLACLMGVQLIAPCRSEKLSQLVLEVEADIKKVRGGDPVDKLEFFLSPKFMVLYNQADQYKEDALLLMADKQYGDLHRAILVTAMHNVNPSALVPYCKGLLMLVKAGTLEEIYLRQQIFSNSRFAGLETPEIISFLNDLIASTVVSDRMRSDITTYILSGQLQKEVAGNERFLPRQ
jgi:hypothetical protein